MKSRGAASSIQIVVVEDPANLSKVFLELPSVDSGCIRNLTCRLPSEGHGHFFGRVAKKVAELASKGLPVSVSYFERSSCAEHGAVWRRQCEELAARLNRAEEGKARGRRLRAQRAQRLARQAR